MRIANLAGRATFVVDGAGFDVAESSGGRLPADPSVLLSDHWPAAIEFSKGLGPGTGLPIDTAQLRSPVPAPPSIFGLVANYPPAVVPEFRTPMVFGKFTSSVTGPFDPIRLPSPERLPMGHEWTVLEAELAVVIGEGGRNLTPEQALGRIAGFTVAQDITERVHEFGPRGTSVGTMEYESLKALGKSLDSFCPLGPVLVTLDEFADPLALNLECRLNGVVVQRASTADMLMGVADLVSFLSAFLTLRPGDVVLTGTPTPLDGQLPRLTLGDVVETEIEGIGTIRNMCVSDDQDGLKEARG